MTKDDVIEEFCKLSTKVGKHLGHRFASDCFCSSVNNPNFQFEYEVFSFIADAVETKIRQSADLPKGVE